MRQDLLPAWVYLEFCIFSQRVITTLHALWYIQVPEEPTSTKYGPDMNVKPLGSTHG